MTMAPVPQKTRAKVPSNSETDFLSMFLSWS
jgi:hypothetical protein